MRSTLTNEKSTVEGGRGGALNKSDPKQFALDQEKARENLNEQLARILSKRKGYKP